MFEGSSAKLFRKYALPQMVGLLFNSIYILVDGLFIGNLLGRDSLASAGVGVPLMELLIALSMGLSSGAGSLLSLYLAKGEEEKARSVFNTAFLSALLLSLLIAVFGNVFSAPLAKALGATDAILEESQSYLIPILSLSPFLVFSYFLGAMVRNDGKPTLAMVALTIGSLSNILLDYLFMGPAQMGVRGASLATGLGPILSDLLLLPHFLRKKNAIRFSKAKPSFALFFSILRLGLPSFLMEFTIGIVTYFYNLAIVKFGFGEMGLASYLLIGYLMLIFLTIFLGFGEGLQPVFSHFEGTGEKKRAVDLRRFSALIFTIVGIVFTLLIFFFSKYFYTLFNPEDKELIAFASERSQYYFLGFVFAGYNILLISYFQSRGKALPSLVISILRSLIFPPLLLFTLPLLFNEEAIWISHSLSEALTAVVALILLLVEERKGKKKDLTDERNDEAVQGAESVEGNRQQRR